MRLAVERCELEKEKEHRGVSLFSSFFFFFFFPFRSDDVGGSVGVLTSFFARHSSLVGACGA